jgi:cell wall integrity and stress response component
MIHLIQNANCHDSGMWLDPSDTVLDRLSGSFSTYCTGGTRYDASILTATPVKVVGQTTTTTALWVYASYAVPLVVRYAASDTSRWSATKTTTTGESGSPSTRPNSSNTQSFYTTTASTSGSATSTSILTTTSSANSEISGTNSNETYARTNGLSTGAVAGIGVGAAIAVIGAIVVSYLWFKSRRKRQAASPSQSMPFATYDNMKEGGASAISNIPNSDGSPFLPNSQQLSVVPSAIQLNDLQVPKRNAISP